MSDNAVNDHLAFNRSLIEEFRANSGKTSGPFADAPLLLLTTKGRKSGEPRTSPVVFTKDGDDIVVIASKAGAPTNPDWFHNLVADSEVTVELPGDDTFTGTAIVTEGDKRDQLFAAQAELMPGFKDYEKATDRVIPVVLLRRSA